MRSQSLNAELSRIRQLIDLISSTETTDELRSHWGQYLCIRVAVLLEVGLRTIYADYARRSSSPQVAGYVERRLERVSNPNPGRFLDVAGEFDGYWRESLRTYLRAGDGSRRDAIDTIMKNRNSIVHGRPSSITIRDVERCLEHAVKVLEFIEDQCAR